MHSCHVNKPGHQLIYLEDCEPMNEWMIWDQVPSRIKRFHHTRMVFISPIWYVLLKCSLYTHPFLWFRPHSKTLRMKKDVTNMTPAKYLWHTSGTSLSTNKMTSISWYIMWNIAGKTGEDTCNKLASILLVEHAIRYLWNTKLAAWLHHGNGPPQELNCLTSLGRRTSYIGNKTKLSSFFIDRQLKFQITAWPKLGNKAPENGHKSIKCTGSYVTAVNASSRFRTTQYLKLYSSANHHENHNFNIWYPWHVGIA